MISFSRETELAAVIVAWLESRGWTVRQEVQFGRSSIDIVATRGSKVWAIEVKLSLNLDVAAQALERRYSRQFHRVSVAVPMPISALGEWRRRCDVLLDLQIGVLAVTEDCQVKVIHDATPLVPGQDPVVLTDAQASGRYAKAGSNTGGRHTSLSPLKEAVREFVAAHRNCSIDQIAAAVAPKRVGRHREIIGKTISDIVRGGGIPGVCRSNGTHKNARYFIEEVSL